MLVIEDTMCPTTKIKFRQSRTTEKYQRPIYDNVVTFVMINV